MNLFIDSHNLVGTGFSHRRFRNLNRNPVDIEIARQPGIVTNGEGYLVNPAYSVFLGGVDAVRGLTITEIPMIFHNPAFGVYGTASIEQNHIARANGHILTRIGYGRFIYSYGDRRRIL